MPSTAIADLRYDDEHHQLTVVFTSGRVYRYFDVPPHLAAAFQWAASRGTFFNTRVRDRYRFQEITPGAFAKTVPHGKAPDHKTARHPPSSPRSTGR